MSLISFTGVFVGVILRLGGPRGGLWSMALGLRLSRRPRMANVIVVPNNYTSVRSKVNAADETENGKI